VQPGPSPFRYHSLPVQPDVETGVAKTVSIIDLACDDLDAEGWQGGKPRTWKELLRLALSRRDIPVPVAEVDDDTGKVVRLLWTIPTPEGR
jgi:hypothetical protein